MTPTDRVAPRTPVTEAGRALLDWYAPRENGLDPGAAPFMAAIVRIENEALRLSLRVLSESCDTVVGPWFDESHDGSNISPAVLVSRIVAEYHRRVTMSGAHRGD